MNLEEAKSKLIITSEEEKSVGDYINHFHTQINVLASFDALKYLELYQKGWGLEGGDVVKSTGESNNKEIGIIILERIDDLTNVYSAMCKYSRISRCPSYLYRGSSNNAAKKIGTEDSYDRIISTTTRLDVAKTFTEYNNAAILRIHVGEGIPFLDVDDFIGVENINREENEVILSPFSKVNRAEYSYQDESYSYYDVRLEKPELRPFKEGEKEKFKGKIENEFLAILELGREYSNLNDQDEINFYRLQRAQNREDIDYIQEKMDENFHKKSEIRPILDEFSEIMKNYIQGLCLEKQREFEEASRIVEEDNKRRIEEEQVKILENQRKTAVEEYNSKILSVNQNFINVPASLEFCANDLILKSEKFSEMCSVIGIPFNSSIDIQSMKLYMSTVQKNVNGVIDEIDLSVIPDNSKMELVETLSENLEEIYLASNQTNTFLQEINESIKQYNVDAIKDIKRGIDFKAQAIIKSARIEQLKKQKEFIKKRRISLFGKIAGKEKLKEIELENLDLQIEYERTRPVVQKDEYSIHDSLSDVLVFSKEELNGQMTPAMQELFSTVTMYFGINRDSIDKKADEKISYKPTVLENPQIGIKEKKSRLASENVYLKQEIQNNAYKNSCNYGLGQYNINSGAAGFTDALNKIAQITKINGILQKRNLDEKTENEKDNSDENVFKE